MRKKIKKIVNQHHNAHWAILLVFSIGITSYLLHEIGNYTKDHYVAKAANAATLAILLGLGLAQSWSSREQS